MTNKEKVLEVYPDAEVGKVSCGPVKELVGRYVIFRRKAKYIREEVVPVGDTEELAWESAVREWVDRQ